MALHACLYKAYDGGRVPFHEILEALPKLWVVAPSVVPKEYPHLGLIDVLEIPPRASDIRK